MFNVLFICTGNSARSIMAEAILNASAKGRFKAYSAGSKPSTHVHPMAMELLEKSGVDTSGLHTKSWREFAEPGAPEMDLIITVCDQAKGEICPNWPGQPITAHWGIEDPVEKEEEEGIRAFRDAKRYLENRIRLLVELPIEKIEKLKLKQQVEHITDQVGQGE